MFGVLHLREGNTIQLPDRQLFVDEACSGIVSLFAIITCAGIFGVMKNRPPIHGLLLLVAGVIWATALNVVRISTIAIAHAWFQIDLATGWPHELLGVVLFAAVLGPLIVTDELFLAWLAPIEIGPQISETDEFAFGRHGIRLWDYVVHWGVPDAPCSTEQAKTGGSASTTRHGTFHMGLVLCMAAGFAMLGLWQWRENALTVATLNRALSIERSLMPATLAGMSLQKQYQEKRAIRHQFGEFSTVFVYAHSADAWLATVSCDYAFSEWHELTGCYRAIGWQVESRNVIQSADSGWSYVEARLSKTTGEHGVTYYCAFDIDGNPVEPPAWLGKGLRALQTRNFNPLTPLLRAKRRKPIVYQVQVFISNPSTPLAESQFEVGRQALLLARDNFRSAIALKKLASSKER